MEPQFIPDRRFLYQPHCPSSSLPLISCLTPWLALSSYASTSSGGIFCADFWIEANNMFLNLQSCELHKPLYEVPILSYYVF